MGEELLLDSGDWWIFCSFHDRLWVFLTDQRRISNSIDFFVAKFLWFEFVSCANHQTYTLILHIYLHISPNTNQKWVGKYIFFSLFSIPHWFHFSNVLRSPLSLCSHLFVLSVCLEFKFLRICSFIGFSYIFLFVCLLLFFCLFLINLLVLNLVLVSFVISHCVFFIC